MAERLYYHPESECYFVADPEKTQDPGDGLGVEIGDCKELAALERELAEANKRLARAMLIVEMLAETDKGDDFERYRLRHEAELLVKDAAAKEVSHEG